ncbi:MAG TPA: hypothetical protein VNX21_03325, partial [Candidatus Thermoplasmatota archaeon]|nr:hypothetical protein [Candidatus Thermoplasmatota archaeon]
MTRFTNGFALLVGAVLLTQATAAQMPQDDAGLGGDAPDHKSLAAPLPGPGSYAGELRSRDADWYALDRAADPACVRMDASGDTSADATLALRAAQAERSIRAPLVEGAVTRLALAG